MKKEEDVDRRGGKTISMSEQGWTLLAHLGQLKIDRTSWKGIVAKSSVVPQRSCKVMG